MNRDRDRVNWGVFAYIVRRILATIPVMAVVALLREKPNPTDAEIDAAITNLCRCSTYVRVRPAIHAAAKALQAQKA